MLKRELSKLESYTTLIGVMVGAGIFVAIGQAGKDTGPATFLAYLLLGPLTLLTALPYVIFHSTPLGHVSGGAYVHISRTFKSYLPGFITMWLTWLTYVGVVSVLSLSVGNYIQAFWPGLNPKIVASACLLLFFVINVMGVKNYGRIQNTLFIILVVSVILVIVPGMFSVRAENFTPFFPKGVDGFIKALSILFFAYAGFDALAQTAGETKSATQTLPGTFIRGILIAIAIYVAISFVAFGVVPYAILVNSKMPVAEAAKSFLPFGSQIVAIGAIAAFLTTINACMLVPSRILYVFAKDRVAPSSLSKVSKRFGTPHISLTINVALSLFLVWTHTLSYLIAISLQTLIILYATECLALGLLPWVNKELWQQVPTKLRKGWIVAGGFLACLCQIGLYATIPNPFSLPLAGWATLGLVFYGYARYRGRKEGFDYARNISALIPALPFTQAAGTFRVIESSLNQINAGAATYNLESAGENIILTPKEIGVKEDPVPANIVPATSSAEADEEKYDQA